ncbi:MAG: helix-turn-helix transcriptional regulator [Planctomycetes bacterium]|nr:helix-turn-helix transcriptional regulator [Planctomycetota bacterium]
MARWDLDVFTGGFHPIKTYWKDLNGYPESLAKLYVVVRGEARYALGSKWTALQAGTVYVLPPHPLQRYICEHEVDMYWAHFLPLSLLLRRRLARVDRIHAFPLRAWRHWQPVYTKLPEFFAGRLPGLAIRVQAMLLQALADTLDATPEPKLDDGRAVRERFAPAISYMDDRFIANPPLELIAAAAGLSPIHFHREFTRAFAITPHAYMLGKRMELARQRVLATAEPISVIAQACGYADQFYFSRVFKRHHRLSPQAARASSAFSRP